MPDRGVAVLAEVMAEVISEGKLAEIGVVSLPSFGLFAAGILTKVLQVRSRILEVARECRSGPSQVNGSGFLVGGNDVELLRMKRGGSEPWRPSQKAACKDADKMRGRVQRVR